MSKTDYNPDNYIQVAYGSIGRHARASNFRFPNNSISLEFDLTIQALKIVMEKMYPNWETINIEVKEKKERGGE